MFAGLSATNSFTPQQPRSTPAAPANNASRMLSVSNCCITRQRPAPSAIRNAISFAAPPRDWWIARGLSRPGEHRAGYWVLAALFHIPLYLLLLYRTSEWVRGRAGPSLGFLLLFYWAYWAEHAIIWGDPRFGLAVYPLLVAVAIPPPGAAAVSGAAEPAPARGTAGAGAAAGPPRG